MTTGRFIVVDGIAGSGKSTVADAASVWAARCGHRVFQLKDAERAHQEPPAFETIGDVDVLFTYEPTRSWVGAAIRGELSRKDIPYQGLEIAHAFALDRQILYRRLILPALAAGKTVIQERSVSSSIVYQPIMPGGPTLEALLALPGNAQAMERAPDHLILTRIQPEMSVGRLANRDAHLSAFGGGRGVFADIDYLCLVDERFRSPWFRELWERRGTKVHELNTESSKEAVNAAAEQLIESLLPLC